MSTEQVIPSNTKIPHLKANSIVPISLDLSKVNSLYTIYKVLVDTLKPENVPLLKTKFESKQPLSELEISVIGISQILQIIHKTAEELNLIEYHSLEETLAKVAPTS